MALFHYPGNPLSGYTNTPSLVSGLDWIHDKEQRRPTRPLGAELELGIALVEAGELSELPKRSWWPLGGIGALFCCTPWDIWFSRLESRWWILRRHYGIIGLVWGPK